MMRIDSRGGKARAYVLVFAGVPKVVDVHFEERGLVTFSRFNALCSQKRWEGLEYIRSHGDVRRVYLRDHAASNESTFDLQILFTESTGYTDANIVRKVVNAWYFCTYEVQVPLSRWIAIKYRPSMSAKALYKQHKDALRMEQQKIHNARKQAK